MSALLWPRPTDWHIRLEARMPWWSVISWAIQVGPIEVRRWSAPPLSYEERLAREQNVRLAVGYALLTLAAALVIWAMWWAAP